MRNRKGSKTIPSPCRSICTIDEATGLCAGCFRTRQEIAGWVGFDDAARLAIVAALRIRRRKAGLSSAADQRPRRRKSQQRLRQQQEWP
ncbi:MAG: DUF1289 domain-containing protein [Pseudomonadota bacterium]